MTETVAPPQPKVVEPGQPQKGWAGQNVPRKEDKRLVQGEGVFFDDIKRHEMGYVHFVRSPYAHARIRSVDVSKALDVPGVYGTLTGDEVAILTDPFFELSTPPGAHMKDYALAVGKVRFTGEPVAAVVANTRELARDAAELVEVEYEPLEPIVDAREAQAEDAPILHDDAGSNVVWEGTFDWGDLESALAEADHVVNIKELHFDRFSSTPLECSGCLVEYNRGTGQWTMYCNHQMPGVGAIWMAPALRVGIDKLRFVTQDIGGAFGNKICLHPQFVACCLLARKLNRPVEVRKRNYVRREEMPYETPNGCIYDSGDYARCLDIVLELVDYDRLEERRRDAEARGKLFGFGIGSTLDSGTNNFGQSTLLNPELQFSGNNEVATVKLDIFGEIVVTLGTVPQGQGHETTAAQVVSDILGCSPDDVNVRPGHDTYWNSHAGFSGTYASQFAVTGLGAVKGAADMLSGEMRKVASVVLGCSPDDIELAEGQARIKGNPEAALPFMALGAILNANNAGLPEDLDVTLNCRYVYRPPFEKPDLERKYGNLTLTYASQVHACVLEVDPETGVYEIVDYAAVDDCGKRIHPQIVEGQVHGATAQGIGAATHETFPYDEDGNLLTPNFYDYHVPHALDMPPLKNGFIESESPFTPLGAKGMGEGGGAGIHAVCSALQDALGGAVVYDSCNPYWRVWEMLQDPEATRERVEVVSR